MLNVEHYGRRGHAFAVDNTVVGTLKIGHDESPE